MASALTAAGTLLDAKVCFHADCPISDHQPQLFRANCGGRFVEVLTWNVMVRGRSGQVGRQGTALEGRALTNNGLDCDETPEAYALRLRDRVAPAVAKWLASAASAWVASFQEFPAHPLLQEEFLAVLRQTRASVQLAVGSGKTKGGAIELASYCNAVAWAGDIWTDPPQEVSVSFPGLGLVLNGSDWRLSVLSFHLPFVDAPGGPRYGESLQAAKAFLRRLGGWLAGPLLAAGDFNTSVELLEDEARSVGAELALMPKSAVFRDQQLSTDGCVLLAKPGGAADVEAMSQVEGVYRGSCAGLFAGMDRDAFVSKYIAQSLHEEPRLWRLSDGGVATLGRWAFAEQPKELTRQQVVLEAVAAPTAEEPRDFGMPEGAVAGGPGAPPQAQARIPSPLPVSALREGSDAQGWWQILAETRAQRRELERRGELELAAQEVA
ncbi:abcG22 [Symbiodinium sp. CCMP2456]|nr:abcG22 [Symbiodinium sp. CCMP2456]